MWYSKEYDPIQVGSIDGTDTEPHDAAIARATRSDYRPPRHLKTDPNNTLFISRLNFDTTESTIRSFFKKYGTILNVELIRNNVTGLSQGYAFVTFDNPKSTRDAYRDADEAVLDDHVIFVDYERSRVMVGWIPRRLGGGYGGKKESGQLRFGARDRPFRDSHGKVKIQYEQKRSDVWRLDSSKGSNERNESRHGDRYDSNRHSDHSHSTRSHSERDRYENSRHSDKSHRSRHRSPSRKHTSDSRYHSDYKRKREDSPHREADKHRRRH